MRACSIFSLPLCSLRVRARSGKHSRKAIRAHAALSAVPEHIASSLSFIGGANSPIHNYELHGAGQRTRLQRPLSQRAAEFAASVEQAQADGKVDAATAYAEVEQLFSGIHGVGSSSGSRRSSKQRRGDSEPVRLPVNLLDESAAAAAAVDAEHMRAQNAGQRRLLDTEAPLRAPRLVSPCSRLVLLRCCSVTVHLAELGGRQRGSRAGRFHALLQRRLGAE